MTPARTTLLLALALSAAACRSRPDPCGDPVQATQAFLRRLEAGDRAGAFALLSREARARIEAAAEEAGRTLGRKIEPHELLVPERSVFPPPDRLRLRPRTGDDAWVEVKPAEGSGGGDDVPWTAQRLVHEDGCWRIDLFHPVAAEATPADRAGVDR